MPQAGRKNLDSCTFDRSRGRDGPRPDSSWSLLAECMEVAEPTTPSTSWTASLQDAFPLVSKGGHVRTLPDGNPSRPVHVVLFSGGRGSRRLAEQLAVDPRVRLTLAINGYDDGKSTGEVRRFFGDCLGPSDFRKNAAVLAKALDSCRGSLIELLELRFPEGCSADRGLSALDQLRPTAGFVGSSLDQQLATLREQLGDSLAPVASRLDAFRDELDRVNGGFDFSDCSVGNLVFAGCFLVSGRSFNRAIEDYCQLLHLRRGLIENVSDGSDAHLVALDRTNRLLPSEAKIVEAGRRNHISELFLLGSRFPQQPHLVAANEPVAMRRWLREHSRAVQVNTRLVSQIDAADLIIYGPGTQHSSLLPSYLTEGLGVSIARNLRAAKVLVTNIHEDTEIPDLSAMEIIEQALFYLRGKNRWSFPAPSLVTHYLLNDPDETSRSESYVPVGSLETLEDPRPVRIANYEDGRTGRHHAGRVLEPFLETFLRRGEKSHVAVLLLDTSSLDKVAQTILEAVRAGLETLPLTPHFLYWSESQFPDDFLARCRSR